MMFFSVRMKSEVGPDPDEAAAMLEMGLFDPIPIVLKGDPSAVDLLFASLPQTRREERDDEAHRQRASNWVLGPFRSNCAALPPRHAAPLLLMLLPTYHEMGNAF
ncbi:Uncharacterized protein APZ42_027111 [Daphnia magna]|uniref:Uncharacterized protein n=1 Tax=Daphnia magna TaxID=35525 RepID=A0A164RNU1_9CRUS|nr:Uncharacterized protein APZ42_027111 [Daphnia magna]